MSSFLLLFGVLFFIGLMLMSKTKKHRINFVTKNSPQIIQLLETVYLLDTTTNLKTFDSRYLLATHLCKKLSQISKSPFYKDCVEVAIIRYKDLYYDRLISTHQSDVINDLTLLSSKEMYKKARVDCFSRYADKIGIEIKALKTKDAKESRINSIKEEGQLLCDSLTDKNDAELYHRVQSIIAAHEESL
jgi:hypothetical protein